MKVVDARVMRLSFLLILACLLAVTADTKYEKEKQRLLERNGILKMDMSKTSRDEFKSFMSLFCLTHLSNMEFLANYIRWEHVEFMDSVRDFLDPTQQGNDISSYFNHPDHDFASNCSVKNDTKQRHKWDEINYDTLFDNYMYDMMTRNTFAVLSL